MQSQILLTGPVAAANEPVRTPHLPVRVFLLSDSRLLREAFARVLKNYGGISLVGAREFSTVTAAEIIASDCHTLLIDPLKMTEFDPRILDRLQIRFLDFQIVLVEPGARISDVLSSILTLPRKQIALDGDGKLAPY